MTQGTRWIVRLLAGMRGRRIAVVGDLMLDEWYWGSVRRISPEAPVPVVEVTDHTYTLGGAGNVANNLAALGARVALFGVVGTDDAGRRLLDLCARLGVDAHGIVRDPHRPTTQKMRIVAHNQQVVRADRESTDPVEGAAMRAIARGLRALDGAVDGVIISDYGKGLISPALVRTVRNYRNGTLITADPKPHNIDAFAGVDCLAPNAAELQVAAGIQVTSEADLARAARMLMQRTGASYILVTRGERGMTLFGRRGKPLSVPALARQVYDVSGAGDTVVSTLTLARAAGASMEDAVRLANLAAGVVVEKLGTATATPDEIVALAHGKALPPAQAPAGKGAGRRRAGRR